MLPIPASGRMLGWRAHHPSARRRMRHPGRGGAAWRRVRQQVLEASNICVLCGQPIDLALNGRHRLGPTVHHIIPISRTGHLPPDEQRALALNPAYLVPAHQLCNRLQGDSIDATPTRNPNEGSRQW